MSAVGIDLGGTKIAAQVFDADWQVVDVNRVPTPRDYDALVAAVAGQVAWADKVAGIAPVGIGAAGLINPTSGLALTANLCATGHPFPADIDRAVGRATTYVNDCRALALSEAVFGAGRGHRVVMSLILGTGVGGGVAIDGRLMPGPLMTGGEFGHTSASAAIVQAHGLPITRCGCGRMGCIETLIAGAGLTRIAQAVTGQALTPPQIAAAKADDPAVRSVWDIWCALTADLLRNLTLAMDPDIIVLGGGLSQIAGVADDLTLALQAAQLEGYATAPIVCAQGGPESGARGAAYAAVQAHD